MKPELRSPSLPGQRISGRQPASHVQAAVRALVQPQMRPAQGSPAAHVQAALRSVQAKPAATPNAAPRRAPHVGEVLQASKKKKDNEQQSFFKNHNKKKKHVSWNTAIQGFGQYVKDKDKMFWLQVASQLNNCGLPVDVGHGSGGSGDYDLHVNGYLDGYIQYVVKPACKNQLGFSDKKSVKKALNIS